MDGDNFVPVTIVANFNQVCITFLRHAHHVPIFSNYTSNLFYFCLESYCVVLQTCVVVGRNDTVLTKNMFMFFTVPICINVNHKQRCTGLLTHVDRSQVVTRIYIGS